MSLPCFGVPEGRLFYEVNTIQDMEEGPKQEYILSQAEKDQVDQILTKLTSPSQSEDKEDAAEKLAYRLFMPWRDSRTKSFQTYFGQKEGPKKLVDALKAVQDPDSELQRLLMTACWNYGDTTENQLDLIQAGALPVIISLIRSPDQVLSDLALGGVWGMLEIEQLLDSIAEEKVPEVIVQRLNIPQTKIHQYLTARYRILGCMQCAAVNENCRKQMLPAVEQVLPVLLNEENFRHSLVTSEVRLGFCHIAVFLAYMAIDDSIRNTPVQEDIIKALNIVMRHSSVELVAAAENDLGYVWQYMTAYLPLVESDIPEIRRFGTYALAYLSKSGANRSLMIKQKVLERIQMLTYSQDPATREYATAALSNFKTRLVPSLKTWCYWRIVEAHGIKECKKILAEYSVEY